MALYEIVANGLSMGRYEAQSQEEALGKYARAAGYKSYADACEVAGTREGEVKVVEVEVED